MVARVFQQGTQRIQNILEKRQDCRTLNNTSRITNEGEEDEVLLEQSEQGQKEKSSS
jgi:hypothetical protein